MLFAVFLPNCTVSREGATAGYGYRLAYFCLVVGSLQPRMMSYTPSSATPNDAWTRRTFSATRCSWVPEKRAPAMRAPTITSATIAMASAMPRSFFRTCFIDCSLSFTRKPARPSPARAGRHRARSAPRVVPQRDAGHNAVHLVRLHAIGSADWRGRAGAQHDLDLRHLGGVGGDRPDAVVVGKRHPVGADQRSDHGLDSAALRRVAL